MKRLASGFLALALTVMPAVAFAEGNDTNTTPTSGSTTEQPATTNPDQTQNNGQNQGQDTTTPGTGEQGTQTGGNEQGNDQNTEPSDEKEKVKIVVDPALFPSDEEEGAYVLGLSAKLKGVKKAEGTWTVEVNGQKHEFQGAKIKEQLIPLGKGDHFTVKIHFTGTVDGKEVTAKKKLEVNVPVFKVEYKVVDGKQEFSGKIENIKNAKGNWYFGVGYPDSEEAVDEKFYEGVEGLSLTHSFNLKPGEYVGVVGFEGYVDGVYTVLFETVEFEVKEDGKGEVKEPSDKDKTPVVNPDEGKKILDEAKKGGKLPKTATTYPTGAVAGLALLAGGLALLKLRRTA